MGVARRTRKARLRLSRLDPWSVMKTSFLFSIAAGIMLVVAVYSVWTVLSTSQLFDSVNEIVESVVSTPGDTTPFRIQEYVNTQKVMGVAALIACVDVVIFTALATLGLVPVQPGRHHARRPGDHPRRGLTLARRDC